MDALQILIIIHVVAGVLGVGGATFIEIIFNTSIKDGKMDETERGFMRITTRVLRIGLFASIFTGLGIILLYRFNDQLFRLYDPVLWAKFTILFALMINGVLLQLHKVPLSVGSAVSFISWYSVFVLGLMAKGPNYSYLWVMFWYVAALIAGGFILEGVRRSMGIKLH